VNPAMAAIVEFVQKTSGYIILGVVFVFSNLYQNPLREAEYRADLTRQRQDYISSLKDMDIRDTAQLASVQVHCETLISDNHALLLELAKVSRENHDMLIEILSRMSPRK